MMQSSIQSKKQDNKMNSKGGDRRQERRGVGENLKKKVDNINIRGIHKIGVRAPLPTMVNI